MNKIGVLFIMLFTFSCAEKLMEKPENLIPQEKMVDILRDLAILNAARTTSASVLQKNDVAPMPYLYAKYGIDSVQFATSDLYYASLPEEYEAIYTKVEARLESEKEAVQELKRVNDSLAFKARKADKKANDVTDSLP